VVQATQSRQIRQEQLRDGSRDFDFLNGRYRVHNVRFAGRLEQSERWETFEAISVATPLPRGIGRIDELVADGRNDRAGATLRLYDRRTRRWSLYRVDSASGMLQPPLQGAFQDVGNYPLLKALIYFNAKETPGEWGKEYTAPDWRISGRGLLERIAAGP